MKQLIFPTNVTAWRTHGVFSTTELCAWNIIVNSTVLIHTCKPTAVLTHDYMLPRRLNLDSREWESCSKLTITFLISWQLSNWQVSNSLMFNICTRGHYCSYHCLLPVFYLDAHLPVYKLDIDKAEGYIAPQIWARSWDLLKIAALKSNFYRKYYANIWGKKKNQ